MAHTRRQYRWSTRPKRCTKSLRGTTPIPMRCMGRRYKAGRCRDHFMAWKAERDARRLAPPQVDLRWSGTPSPVCEHKRPRTRFDHLRLERADAKRARKAALGRATPRFP